MLMSEKNDCHATSLSRLGFEIKKNVMFTHKKSQKRFDETKAPLLAVQNVIVTRNHTRFSRDKIIKKLRADSKKNKVVRVPTRSS